MTGGDSHAVADGASARRRRGSCDATVAPMPELAWVTTGGFTRGNAELACGRQRPRAHG
jgi:hypothetical protein